MTAASKTSKRGNERAATPLTDRRRATLERHRLRRQWHEFFAPPDVRHRRREARCWIEETTVRMTNPPVTLTHDHDTRTQAECSTILTHRCDVVDVT